MPDYYASPGLRQIANSDLLTIPLTGIEAQIYDRVWRAIVEGKLKCGGKLREDVIGGVFGVSRTVVRKVMVIMEQEGIVYLPPNLGAYVATPTPEATRAVLEAVHMMMTYIIKALGAPDREWTSEQRHLFDLHIAAQAEADSAGDFVTSRLLTGEYYVLLAAIYGNEILTQQAAHLFTRYVMGLSLYQVALLAPARAASQRQIVDHLIAGEAEAAGAIVMANFAEVERSLRFTTEDEDNDLKAILGHRRVDTPLKAVSPHAPPKTKGTAGRAASSKITKAPTAKN